MFSGASSAKENLRHWFLKSILFKFSCAYYSKRLPMINQEYFYALLKLFEPCREMHRGSLTGLSCTSGCATCLSSQERPQKQPLNKGPHGEPALKPYCLNKRKSGVFRTSFFFFFFQTSFSLKKHYCLVSLVLKTMQFLHLPPVQGFRVFYTFYPFGGRRICLPPSGHISEMTDRTLCTLPL